MRKPLLRFFFFSLCPILAVAGNEAGELSDIPPVIIDYFYEPGCPDCIRVREQIIPELEERVEGFYVLNKHDVGIESNVIKFVAYQEKLGIKENKSVCMVVDYRYVFNGFKSITKGLFGRIDECVTERSEPGWHPPEPIVVQQSAQNGINILEKRVKSFTLPMVLFNGLLDGINPCAISTLAFFISLLAVSKVKGGGLLLMGVPFCLASFMTYTALGFGLLRTLRLFTGFSHIRFGVEIVMIAVLGIFAYMSFHDAYCYKISGDHKQVTLQIPDSIKMRIHKIMRTGLGTGSLVFGGLLIGAAVTALESVCTGQVYVPTLVVVIKSSFDTLSGGEESVSRAWSYLLLYNAMFILPLAVVFVLTYFGLKTETLLNWSRKNVVISKTLFGCFFLAMAVLMGLL